MVSFRDQKKALATPRSISFRSLIQNLLPLSYASPPQPREFDLYVEELFMAMVLQTRFLNRDKTLNDSL